MALRPFGRKHHLSFLEKRPVMRHVIRTFSLAALGTVAVACSRSDATPAPEAIPAPEPVPQPTIEVDAFYADLEAYGDWVELPDHGWSFAPAVDDDWRPYTRGQWEYTDDGWYWDSDEDFGWATYHYGRWVDDRRYGWVWIPGDEWAPAWVSWRQGNGYTGWAPLPPRATWSASVGLRFGGGDLDLYIGARDYNFVEDRYFVDRGIYQRVQPWTKNVDLIGRTTNVTRYEAANNRVHNRGVAIGDVERAVGRKVPQKRTIDRDRRDARGGGGSGEVAVFRPKVRIVSGRRPSRGSSVLKGEAAPPRLVERAQRRERGRAAGGRPAEISAGDAARQKRDVQKVDERRQPPPPRVQPQPKPQREPEARPPGANRPKKEGPPPGHAAKPPKQDPADRKAPKEKEKPKGPKPKGPKGGP
jgi:hypothetical protein